MQNKIKIYSITNGRSTHAYSYKSILKNSGISDVILIENKTWKDALAYCVDTCDTNYFLRVDDDFILHPKAILYMNTCIVDSNVAVYFWRLWEDHSHSIIHAIKVYSINALRNIGGFKFDYMGKVDMATHKFLKKSGYKVVEDKSILAIHACGTKEEQIKYNELWKKQSKNYTKARFASSLLYDKSIKYQYDLRTNFLEKLNKKHNTPFAKWLDENNFNTT